MEHLVPKIAEQYTQSTGYANRVTTLQVLPEIAQVLTGEQIAQSIIPMIVKAARDAVPNVRFTACRTLLTIAQFPEKQKVPDNAINKEITPVLKELGHHDQDSDVQYFATLALQAFEKPST